MMTSAGIKNWPCLLGALVNKTKAPAITDSHEIAIRLF